MKRIDILVGWIMLFIAIVLVVIGVIDLSRNEWALGIGSFAALWMALFFVVFPSLSKNMGKVKRLSEDVAKLKEILNKEGGKG